MASAKKWGVNMMGAPGVKSIKSMKFGLGAKKKKKPKRANKHYGKVTKEMIVLAENCFPPEAPEPLTEEGKQDVSLFVSTFNAQGISTGLSPDVLAFWLPHGFDVYCLGLQSVINMTVTGSSMLDFLQSKGEKYQEYAHFVAVNDPITGQKSSIITYIYVHASLVMEKVFQRASLYRVLFPNLDANGDLPVAGAFVVNFRVFDTEVKVVNCQLTPGQEAQQTRKLNLDFLFSELVDRDDFGDHTFLFGDFGFTNIGEFENSKLQNYVSVQNSIPEWTHDRFQFLLQEYDEMNALKMHVQQLQGFEEMEICYPPTNHRAPFRSNQATPKIVATLFHPRFDLEDLYDYKEDIPCYPDRILHSTRAAQFNPCIAEGKSGTCEGVLVNDRVPVYATFRIGARALCEDDNTVYVSEEVLTTSDPPVKSSKRLSSNNTRNDPNRTSSNSKVVVDHPQLMRAKPNAVSSTIRPLEDLSNTPKAQTKKVPSKPETPKLEMKSSQNSESKAPDVGDNAESTPSSTDFHVLKPTSKKITDVSLIHHKKPHKKGKDSLVQIPKIGAIANFGMPSMDLEILKPVRQLTVDSRSQSWGGHGVGVCDFCCNAITDAEPHLDISGKLFHERCFNCVRCRTRITGNYYNINDFLYCRKCHNDLFNPLCASPSCGKRIRGTRVETPKGAFHDRCFECTECNLPLAHDVDGTIHLSDYVFVGDKLLCKTHANDTSGRECFVCKYPLNDLDVDPFETIVNAGELLHIHSKCLKCSIFDCTIPLASTEGSLKKFCYIVKNNQLLCVSHGNLECGTCTKPIYANEGFREIFNVKYHVRCVPNCSNCSKKLSAKDTVVKGEEEGSLLCSACGKLETQMFASSRRTHLQKCPEPELQPRTQSVLPQTLEDVDFYESNPPPPPPSMFSLDFRQNSTMTRADGRMCVFTGFSIPPPPPLSTTYGAEKKSVSQRRFYNNNSKGSVNTDIPSAAQLGAQLRQLVESWELDDESDIPPPPPPSPTEVSEVEETLHEQALRRRKKRLADSMPSPPPSPMHGNFVQGTMMSSYLVDDNEEDELEI